MVTSEPEKIINAEDISDNCSLVIGIIAYQ